MMFMNECEIDERATRAQDPIVRRAALLLQRFKDDVNAHSDGWPYWSAPVHSAAKLIALVNQPTATHRDLAAALTPIKSFMTRRGKQAGMTWTPTLD